MRELLPAPVLRQIRDHLVTNADKAAKRAWVSASNDEDAITGDFCGQLRHDWSTVSTKGREWRWRVDYRKLRGRGPRPPENLVGADGIFLIEVEGENQEIVSKGLLFQAKKGHLSRAGTAELREQVGRMESIVPGGSAVFEYTEGGFAAFQSNTLLDVETPGYRVRESIGSFLGVRFLECEVGKRGVYYDAHRQRLIVAEGSDLRIETMPIDHRVRVEVSAARRL